MTTITIDQIEYELDSISETAKQQIANVQATDEEIRRLTIQLAIAQTARVAYATALKKELPARDSE